MNQRLVEIFVDIYGLELSEVSPELNIANVGSWNSLNNLRFVTAVEEEFGIELTAEQIQQMTTMPSIISVLTEKGVPVF